MALLVLKAVCATSTATSKGWLGTSVGTEKLDVLTALDGVGKSGMFTTVCVPKRLSSLSEWNGNFDELPSKAAGTRRLWRHVLRHQMMAWQRSTSVCNSPESSLFPCTTHSDLQVPWQQSNSQPSTRGADLKNTFWSTRAVTHRHIQRRL